jgi:hypothetical protein
VSVRFDPTQTVADVEAGLRRAAEAAWGSAALPEIEPALTTAARAVWRISQEPLEPSDVEL